MAGDRCGLSVNGVERVIEADPDTPLLSVLRGALGPHGGRTSAAAPTSAAPATC